jgi:hypothetical protein
MQPNKNPHPRYAAISNDFSIKNSSCSPTKIPTLGMQLFPTTFLSKTAHAAQQLNDFSIQLMQPRYAAISNDFSIKNSSCSPLRKKMEKNHHHPPSTNTHTNNHPPPPPPSHHHHHHHHLH